MADEQTTIAPVAKDVILYSFPKCGRTWFRYIFLELYGRHLAAEHYVHDKAWPLHLVMIRDIRDVIVSYFFEVTTRNGGFGIIGGEERRMRAQWMRSDKSMQALIGLGVIEVFMRFYEQCMALDGPSVVVRYEDLHADPVATVRRFTQAYEPCDDARIEAAVAACSFERMHQIERDGRGAHGYHQGTWLPNLTPGDPENPMSFKTRVGKVGGYEQHLSSADTAAIEAAARAYPFYRDHYGYEP